MNSMIRPAGYEDINAIMKVEESWPESERATKEKFLARLKKFPGGFFVAELEGKICGTITSCLVHYEPMKPQLFRNWDETTNQGYLYEVESIKNPNTLYIVSGVVDKEFRGRKVIDALIMAEVKLATDLGLRYVVAGAVISGYDRYCKRYGKIEAQKYVFLKREKQYVDPLMEKYRKLGFSVPDEKHVIKDYYPDAASRSYAALVVFKIE